MSTTPACERRYYLDTPVDVLFPVRGDCLRAGYGYQLYSAVKAWSLRLAEREDVWLGPVEGVESLGHGLLRLRRGARWRVRCSLQATGDLLGIQGQRLLVGAHVVELGPPTFEEPRLGPVMHAELVTFKSLHWAQREHPTTGQFLGRLWDRLTRLGVAPCDLDLGLRREVMIGGHPSQAGYAVRVGSLTDEAAATLVRCGVGGRRHFGAGLFVAGEPARWLECR